MLKGFLAYLLIAETLMLLIFLLLLMEMDGVKVPLNG